ncbi:MAG: FAD-binding protein, partial [Variibacter sp.]
GGVTGVVVEHNGHREPLNAARGVLLATGGFEWDRERLQQHFPGPIDRLGSSPGNAGDALRMAEQVGAALAHMDQALIYPCLPTRYDGKLHAMPAPIHMEPNAIVVDRHGKRFVSEYAVDLGEALDRRGPDGAPAHLPAWLISDRTFLRPALRWYAHYDPDWIVRAPTIAALADRIKVPREALAETIERFNGFCAKGRDEDFHRGESIFQKAKAKNKPMLSPIRKAPYVAMPFNRCILTTKGGLRTNEHAQVLREDGSVITGLYCAGAAMANPIGTRAISAGTTIGPNMTWGYICAQDVLRTNRPAEAS